MKNKKLLSLALALVLSLVLIPATVFANNVMTLDFSNSATGARSLVEDGTTYVLKGTDSSELALVTVEASCTITLDNINLTNSTSSDDERGGFEAFRLLYGRNNKNPINVTIILKGDNYLTSYGGVAYEQFAEATVNIIGDGTLTIASNVKGNYSDVLGSVTIASTATVIDASGSFPGSVKEVGAPTTSATPTIPVAPTTPVLPVQPTTPAAPIFPILPNVPTVQPTLPAQQGMTVMPTPSKVFVNGMETSFEAYSIGGSNYFKLRDIAFALNGTAKQFNLGYDNATAAINLITGSPYIPAGGEMTAGDGQAKTATLTPSKIYLNGSELYLSVYSIGGNNFFKLVDLMSVLNVGVTYNSTTGTISIDTNANFMGVVTVSEPVTPVTLPAPAPIATPAPAPIATPAPVVTPTDDGISPYDLKWVDGENGIISFSKQLSDDDVLARDYGYAIRLYFNGNRVGGVYYIPPVGNPQEVDIAHMMEGSGAGEYVFEVSLLDENDDINNPVVEPIKSEPYIRP